MSQKQISIIGAGIGARVFGQCLRKKGIPATLFEKGPASQRFPYGITLHQWAYKPLLNVLDMDETTFQKRIAVDSPNLGQPYSSAQHNTSFRAHRGKFEKLLEEGLDIRYDYALDGLDQSQNRVSLLFSNGEGVSDSLIIGFDGVHSTVRKSLLPKIELNVLPFVVFNGKRRIKRDHFDNLYRPKFKDGNVIETCKSDTLLQISINEVKDELVSVSYTYSRPARPGDILHKPERSTAGAAEISEALWDEVAALEDLLQPFLDVFNVETLKRERLLHWPMRIVPVLVDVLKGLGQKSVMLLGDAVHAQPILGGAGANAAILDGIELAEMLSEEGTTAKAIEAFYDKVYPRWTEGIESSEKEIRRMHGGKSVL